MKKAALLLLVTLAAAMAAAQDVKESDVSPATRRYRAYRLHDAEPPFGLARVKALIKGIKRDKDDNERLPAGAYERLTIPEKFTLAMLHGEDESQNCDGMPWFVDEERKIFGHPAEVFGGNAAWSDRQESFLHQNRSAVIGLIRTTMRKEGRVGVNLKAAIVEIQANELIPDLVRAYDRDHRDQDILTVLMLLMKGGKYKPFVDSATYRKLYGPDADWKSFVVANAANERLTTDRALAFYRSRVR